MTFFASLEHCSPYRELPLAILPSIREWTLHAETGRWDCSLCAEAERRVNLSGQTYSEPLSEEQSAYRDNNMEAHAVR